MSKKIHLIIPMGGAGLRFSKDIGFANIPKPLINIENRPFLYHAAECVVSKHPVSNLSFIVLQEHIDKFEIDKVIKKYFPKANIAVLPEQQNGPVMTCLWGIERLPCEDDEMLMISDCDHIFDCKEIFNDIKNAEDGFNALLTFPADSNLYSFVKTKNGKFDGTVEKVVVSNHAICGAYVYKNKDEFNKLATKLLERGLGNYKEYFMSDTYNVIPEDEKKDVRIYDTDYNISFGTPAEYQDVISTQTARFHYPTSVKEER